MISFEYLNEENEIVQDYYSEMPFVIINPTKFVIETFGFNLHHCHENFISNWMKSIDGYPIYFLIEIPKFMEREVEELCDRYSFKSQSYAEFYKVIEVKDVEEFKRLFPLALTIASMGPLVVWTTTYNIFIENKNNENIEPKKIQIAENQSLFCIGHDCESILILTNNVKFKEKEEIVKNFLDKNEY